MSFEEKYKSYKSEKHTDVSEEYINQLVVRVSERIKENNTRSLPIVWSLSGVSFAALVLVLGIFLYPYFSNTPPQNTAYVKSIDSSNAQTNEKQLVQVNANDSDHLAMTAKKNEQKLETKELDNEIIIEYLLDEGYEEI